MHQQKTDNVAHHYSFPPQSPSHDVVMASSSTRRRYDIFLSFRGEDTRDTFSYYLYKAFLGKGIHTFRDDDEMEPGKRVMTELMDAIKESKYAVLVISKNYASSSWCLNELVQILECSESLEQTVYPVFYRVDPSDVRKQKEEFGKGFSGAVSKNSESEQRWKKALEEVAGLKGWVYPSPEYGTEVHFIDALVGDIFHKLKDTFPSPLEGLVGMRPRLQKLLKLLNLESNEARMVGICGMGGLGKTTLARAVYDSIYQKFDGCSFIENAREVATKSGLKAIQEQLISDTLNEKDFKLPSVRSGTYTLRSRVCHKKVLIVLDDVDEAIEVEHIIEALHWFSQGSRIIVTTRDRHRLYELRVEYVYEVPGLNRYEAEELFKSKAFDKKGKTEEFQKLIGRAVHYAGGVPLALKVLGSFLFSRTLPEWESALDRLLESPGDKVQKVLKISYDGLHSQEKEIFLDISCFFRGKNKDEVIKILGACDFNPVIGVEVLVKKNLLTILKNNKVWMHDLLQKMGWTIVGEESQKNEPGKRSRLWRHIDIKHVLTEKTGTSLIEGICDNYPALGAEDFELSPDAFEKMTNLRILRICYTCPSIDLPNELRYLHWHGYPLKRMPSKFQPEYLVELCLTRSFIEQLWDGELVLPELTLLDLRHSTCITKSPDFTCYPKLEKLYLEGCTGLQNLHPSVTKLKNLRILHMKGCTSLKTIPYGFESQCLEILIFTGCFKLRKILERFRDLKQLQELYLNGTGIKEVPHSIGYSTNLWCLDLSHCVNLRILPSSIGQLKKLKILLLTSCYSLNELPEEVGLIENLEVLHGAFSGIRQLPSSVVCFKNLQVLSLRGCNGFSTKSWMEEVFSIILSIRTSNCMNMELPSLSKFNSLTTLDLAFCRLKSLPESISCCSSLKVLVLTKNKFESLPLSIKDLGNLEYLWLGNCKKLQELPELPSTVRYIWAFGCKSLTTICSPYLLKDARVLCFTNCTKLVANEEINSLMEQKFLLNQIKVKKHVDYRVYTGARSKIPKWFTNQNVGASIKIRVPPYDHPSKLLGIALSAVVSTNAKDCKIGVQISVRGNIQKGCWAFSLHQNLVDVFIFYFPIERFMVDSFRKGGTEIEVCFSTADDDGSVWPSMIDEVSGPAPEVKSCGACLMYGHDLGIEEKDDEPIAESPEFMSSASLLILFIFSLFLIGLVHVSRFFMHYVAFDM